MPAEQICVIREIAFKSALGLVLPFQDSRQCAQLLREDNLGVFPSVRNGPP